MKSSSKGFASVVILLIAAAAMAVTAFEIGKHQAKVPVIEEKPVAGTSQVAEAVALFETSLAAEISSSATSITLVSATTKDGNTLASSTYAAIIDEGKANEEIVIMDCTSTACTNVSRGISVETGTSTVSALQKSHRRGASVKITSAPFLIQLINIVKGKQNIPAQLKYESSVAACAANDCIPDKEYTDGVASAGAADSNETTKGIVEQATGAEAAGGAPAGSGNTTAPLALTTGIASSSPVSGSSLVVVASSTGYIDPNFIATSTTDAPIIFGQEITQTASSTNTATSTFAAPVSLIDTLGATSTCELQGGDHTASTTALLYDGSGRCYDTPISYLLKNTNTDTTSSTATTTQITVDIPANSLRGAGIVKIKADVSFNNGAIGTGNDEFTLNLLFGSGNILLASTSIPNASAGISDSVFYGTLDIVLSESGANSQEGTFSGTLRSTIAITATAQQILAIGAQEVKTGSEDTSQTQTLRLDTIEGDSDMLFTVRNYYVEEIR